MNGFYFIEDLNRVVKTVAPVLDKVIFKFPNLNKIGLLRSTLRIADSDYVYLLKDGNLSMDNTKYDTIRAFWRSIK